MRSDPVQPSIPSNRPLILLIAGIAVMAAVAFEAYRATRSQRETVDEVLRDYTAFATWSLEQHVRAELDATFWQMLRSVNHGDALHTSPEYPSAEDLAHTLPWDSASCYCHRPRHSPAAFLAFTLGADTMAVAANRYAGPGPGSRVVPVPPELPEFRHLEAPADEIRRIADAERERLRRHLTSHARTSYRRDERYEVLTLETAAGRSLVGYTLMPTSWGDTLVYAVELGPATVQRLFDGVIDGDELLPEAFTRGRTNRGVLVAEVVEGESGDVIYRSDPGALPAAFVGSDDGERPTDAPPTIAGEGGLGSGPAGGIGDDTGETGDGTSAIVEHGQDARADDDRPADGAVRAQRLPRRFGSLAVRAAIRPEAAGSLVIGGLPRSRLPYLLGVFALACALAIAGAVQVRRTGELARLRAQFVASVSHELRTPLSQIRMYLQTLRLGRHSTDEQREWLIENADRESARLVGLVENVLAFGRDAANGSSPAPAAPLDVAEEVRRAVEAYRPLAAYRRARIELDRGGRDEDGSGRADPTDDVGAAGDADDVGPLPARITPSELRQVLFNLLDNAVKYGPAGQTITVRCTVESDAVRLAVTDRGPGVAAGERDRIWRPFHRAADVEAGRAVGGSGIGLSVVRGIVERRGGRARVGDSPDGRGAHFVVELPLAAGADAKADSNASAGTDDGAGVGSADAGQTDARVSPEAAAADETRTAGRTQSVDEPSSPDGSDPTHGIAS